jgi:uncharacterized SAM-binding protein YcdF (DUF218 family)
MSSQLFHPLADPLDWVWLFLVLAALYYLWKRQWSAILAPALAAALLSLAGSTWFSSGLLASLERPYAGRPRAEASTADAVVVLGSWARLAAAGDFKMDLGESVDRLITGVELVRQHKARALVLAGGGRRVGGQLLPENRPVEQWLASWQVLPGPIHVLPPSQNTREEALHLKTLIEQQRWRHVFLVTSASHLRRAEATFRAAGVPVTAVGSDFVGMARLETPRPFSPFPRPEELQALAQYLHEIIGWWYYRARGWV